MNVPAKNHPRWLDIVTGKKTYDLKFLPVKIMLGRTMRIVKEEPTSANIKGAIDHLHSIYAKNESSPVVQEDMKTVFG